MHKGFNRGFRSKFTSTGGWNGDWVHDPDPCRRDVWTRTVRRDADGTVTGRRDDDNEHHHDVDVGV